jgi:hypothetical protein
MKARKQWAIRLLFFGISFFFAGQLAAQINQMNLIYRFKKVGIPVDLRLEGSILARGEYDLAFFTIPSSKSFFLRIFKKGKIMNLLQGKHWPYAEGSAVPKKPVLNMNLNRDEKMLLILFESGSGTRIYAGVRATFQIPYEGE